MDGVEPDLDDTVSGGGRPGAVPRKRTLADLDDDTLFSKLRGGGIPLRAAGDVDDTVLKAPKEATAPRGADFDATVARGSVVPPALVEPPTPEARPLPVVESLADLDIRPPSTDEEATSAPAPLRARFADGSVVALDATVYVGRKPSIPRIHTGPEPRLVTLPSPSHELSATHLELRAVGATIVASDMLSTNGTVVRLPGSAPRTLIRGESAVVVPGTRIDLGDGAILDILGPETAGAAS